MSRGPLAIGAASGSLASLALRAVLELSGSEPLAPPSSSLLGLDCTCPAEGLEFWGFDLRSVGLGILIGVSIGPICEVILLLRWKWVSFLRSRLFGSDRDSGPKPPRPLYRLL